MMKVRRTGNQIVFGKGGTSLTVTLHRTLRLPEDGRTHSLPPSLGSFPLKMVDDYRGRVPSSWVEHGGVFLPMWQCEAMWMSFSSGGRPAALKVAAGKINAVSGKKWKDKLSATKKGKQDYIVAPPQPWLDGFNTGDGVIKQFIAMPLGQGYTVEGQLTGKEEFGGVQLLCAFPKKGLLGRPRRTAYRGGPPLGGGGGIGGQSCGGMGGIFTNSSATYGSSAGGFGTMGSEPYVAVTNCSVTNHAEVKTKGGILRSMSLGTEMGLGAGGTMKQKIYPDPHGLGVWDQSDMGRIYIHIVNSAMYQQITGEAPPPTPITAQTYASHGYPWYELYDDCLGDVKSPGKLGRVKTIAEKGAQQAVRNGQW